MQAKHPVIQPGAREHLSRRLGGATHGAVAARDDHRVGAVQQRRLDQRRDRAGPVDRRDRAGKPRPTQQAREIVARESPLEHQPRAFVDDQQRGHGKDQRVRGAAVPAPPPIPDQARDTNHTFIGSCGSTWRSAEAKPLSFNSASAVSHPHIVPSPAPPWPIDTGVQWQVEIA